VFNPRLGQYKHSKEQPLVAANAAAGEGFNKLYKSIKEI